MLTFRYSIVYAFGLFAVLRSDHCVAPVLSGPIG